jgi:hypothetical protein
MSDALRVICDKNLNRPRNFGDFGFFGDMGHEIILAKILKLYLFGASHVCDSWYEVIKFHSRV